REPAMTQQGRPRSPTEIPKASSTRRLPVPAQLLISLHRPLEATQTTACWPDSTAVDDVAAAGTVLDRPACRSFPRWSPRRRGAGSVAVHMEVAAAVTRAGRHPAGPVAPGQVSA